MPDEMLDYNVDTTVQFKLPEMSSEFNSLAVNDLRKVFVEHVKNVFEKMKHWEIRVCFRTIEF